ncbi:hypothetical protein NDU88_011319, partial [Pleurodeles waltl]
HYVYCISAEKYRYSTLHVVHHAEKCWYSSIKSIASGLRSSSTLPIMCTASVLRSPGTLHY